MVEVVTEVVLREVERDEEARVVRGDAWCSDKGDCELGAIGFLLAIIAIKYGLQAYR